MDLLIIQDSYLLKKLVRGVYPLTNKPPKQKNRAKRTLKRPQSNPIKKPSKKIEQSEI